jgi:molecular chaperone GrpE (heat shock protein)
MNINKFIHQLQMLDSLKTAINDAGGSAHDDEALLQMTLFDMLDIFAQNNIRFVYIKK